MVYVRVGNISIECYIRLRLPNIRKSFECYIQLSLPNNRKTESELPYLGYIFL